MTEYKEIVCLFCVDSLHRVLAEDVAAAEPLPPFRASIKDGYAVIGRVTRAMFMNVNDICVTFFGLTN